MEKKMQKKYIEDICLKYLPSDGYNATPLNSRKLLRKKIYNLSPWLYALVQFLLVSVEKKKRSIFNTRKLLFKKRFGKEEKDSFTKQHIANMNTEGFTIIENFLSPEECDVYKQKMNENFSLLNFKRGGYISEKFPTLQGLDYQDLEEIGERISIKNPFINIPEFSNVAFDERVLKIVSGYLQEIPLTSYTIDRSFVLTKFLESAGWHKDTYASNAVQMFVYLQDIDVHNGPLHFVPGSHKNKFKNFKVVYNYEKNINEFDGRITDQELLKTFKENEIKKLTVKKGTAVIVHVNGFHKGPIWELNNHPDNKHRDSLHVAFSSTTFHYDLATKAGKKAYNMTLDQYNKLNNFQRQFTQNFNII